MYKVLIVLSMLLLGACEKSPVVEVPSAKTLTGEASGYYCLMTVVNHKGPKAQIILTDNKVLWFTSVRDMIYFTLSPEEPKNIAAMYVNDMSEANWGNPGADNWIDAKDAFYVLGSDLSGGMGAAETVPFSTKENAEIFIGEHAGTVYTFDLIPKEYVVSSAAQK